MRLRAIRLGPLNLNRDYTVLLHTLAWSFAKRYLVEHYIDFNGDFDCIDAVLFENISCLRLHLPRPRSTTVFTAERRVAR